MRNLIFQIAPKNICLVLFTSFMATIAFGQVIAFELVPPSTLDFDSVKYSSIAFADIDGDNDQDVLITGDNNDYDAISKLYRNDGYGNYTFFSNLFSGGVVHGAVAFADIDGDNDLDIIITGNSSTSGTVSKLYKNNGLGYFTLVSDTPFEGVFFSSVAFADIDGDDDQDLLITGRFSFSGYTSISNLYTNDGNGNYTLVNNTPFDPVIGGTTDFADIDGDGDKDLLITGSKEDFIRISKLYTNDGTGNYTLVSDTPFEAVRSGSVAFADIDGDGDQDVLITGSSNTSRISKLYKNDGLGNFSLVSDTPFLGVHEGSVAFADIDNDSDQDVLITGYFGEILTLSYLYINDGNGNYTLANETLFEGASDGSAAFTDIDGDNDQDVLITGRNGNNKRLSNLYRNNSDQSVGINENIFLKEASIYPNPNGGMVNIGLGNLIDVSIKVLTISGQVVYHRENINTSEYQFELNEVPGIYFIEIYAQGEKKRFKLVIN